MRGETRRFQPLLRHSAGPISAHNQPKSSPRQSLHLTPPSCLLPRSIRPQITFLTDRGPLIRRRSTMAARGGERCYARTHANAGGCARGFCLSEKSAASDTRQRKGEKTSKRQTCHICCVSDWLRPIGQLDEWIASAHAHARTRTQIK